MIPENTLTEETKIELNRIKNGNRASIVYRTLLVETFITTKLL